MPDSRNPSKDPRAPRRSTDEVTLAPQPQPVQTARSRVSSNTSIVNFAPPPSVRRPSWIAPTPDLLAARRPSWTPPLPLDAAGNPMYSAPGHAGSGMGSIGRKTRMFYPATAEESGSGSASGSSNSASNLNSANNSGDDSPPQDGHGGGGLGGDSSEEASSSSNNFRVAMQIDMKRLVGDAVGNMSISPTSRDIVLAARRGLFIIDLESPLSVPRFLPQGGTWDVADVQWNPHTSRAEYIVSTSSEKLLIWNLLLPSPSYPPHPKGGVGLGKNTPVKASASAPSSIAHILHAHYRAITDINWHPAEEERDVVASTGVDSWIWAWDLRAAAGGRAVFGLSAFNAGGTQVKWNRQDPHLLASSHAGEVLIWDRRKGSLPSARLRAHRSKIYGIDWSPARRDELVTCALDGEIKVRVCVVRAVSGSSYAAGNEKRGGFLAHSAWISDGADSYSLIRRNANSESL
ncbi:WD40-repeat-containing domain protein [Mycena metata]|uniref:WD40-repeat-containing domain protein n=1 Tax=Mycena metata TaxID=1033252 RepID=A0AAD7ICK6_9AGAR|nr:WD40-repeat-containing domain protein [Mycena metata]